MNATVSKHSLSFNTHTKKPELRQDVERRNTQLLMMASSIKCCEIPCWGALLSDARACSRDKCIHCGSALNPTGSCLNGTLCTILELHKKFRAVCAHAAVMCITCKPGYLFSFDTQILVHRFMSERHLENLDPSAHVTYLRGLIKEHLTYIDSQDFELWSVWRSQPFNGEFFILEEKGEGVLERIAQKYPNAHHISLINVETLGLERQYLPR